MSRQALAPIRVTFLEHPWLDVPAWLMGDCHILSHHITSYHTTSYHIV